MQLIRIKAQIYYMLHLKIYLKNTELIIFGASSGQDIHGIKTTYMGYISDESVLNCLYNAADLIIVPSRQDNLPNSVLESICCGTPVVGFDIGGLPDMVIHKKMDIWHNPLMLLI